MAYTLLSRDYKSPPVIATEVWVMDSLSSNSMKSRNPHSGFHKETTAKTIDTNPNPACNQGGDIMVQAYPIENHPMDSRVTLQPPDEPCQTLTGRMGTGGGNVPMILEAVSVGNGQLHQMGMEEVARPLDCMHDQQAVLYKQERKYIVRRLTPTECARLQGFPDWWTDGVDGSDSAKYKMYGNAIAVPCAYDVLRRIVEHDH